MSSWRALIIAGSVLLGCSANKGSEPSFVGDIGNVTVALGREAILSCSVTNLDTFKVGWMKAEDQTILSLHRRVVTHNSRISVSNDGDSTWRLHIRQVKESDRGCYMCQINTSTMSKQIGCIDVHVPPDIVDVGTSSDVTVDEGDNTTLTCQARGHPEPRILWRREDNQLIGYTSEEVYSGEFLELVNVDRSHGGAYLCIASNDVPPAVSKRIYLSVNYVPEVRLSHEVVGVHVGSDVRLDCYTEGHPAPNTFWLYNGTIIQQSAKHRLQMDSSDARIGKLRLILRSLTVRDFGPYTCLANNTMGSAHASTRLYEIKLPPTTTAATRRPTTTPRTTTQGERDFRPVLSVTTVRPEVTTEGFESITLVEMYDNELESEGVGARIGVDSSCGSITNLYPPLILVSFILVSS